MVWVPGESCSNADWDSVGLGWGLRSHSPNKRPHETQFQCYEELYLDPGAPTVTVQEKRMPSCGCWLAVREVRTEPTCETLNVHELSQSYLVNQQEMWEFKEGKSEVS